MATTTISFRDLPPDICNYYDKGPSARRVLRAMVRPIIRRKEIIGDEYVVVTNYGKTYFRQDKWSDWKIWKSSESVSC